MKNWTIHRICTGVAYYHYYPLLSIINQNHLIWYMTYQILLMKQTWFTKSVFYMRSIMLLIQKIIHTTWNKKKTSTKHGKYVVILTQTEQDTTSLVKVCQDAWFKLTELSLNGVWKVTKWLHYLLQKLNIQKSRKYVAKYYLYVQFSFL